MRGLAIIYRAYHNVPTGYLGELVLVRPAEGAQVGVTLPQGDEAGALLSSALSLTSTINQAINHFSINPVMWIWIRIRIRIDQLAC